LLIVCLTGQPELYHSEAGLVGPNKLQRRDGRAARRKQLLPGNQETREERQLPPPVLVHHTRLQYAAEFFPFRADKNGFSAGKNHKNGFMVVILLGHIETMLALA